MSKDLTETSIKAKMVEVQQKFDALQKQRTELATQLNALNTEKLRLEGEYRALETLITPDKVTEAKAG